MFRKRIELMGKIVQLLFQAKFRLLPRLDFGKIPILGKIIEWLIFYMSSGTINVQEHKMYINQMFPFSAITSDLLLNEVWEPTETKFIKNEVKENDIVLNIGANIGYYTLNIIKTLHATRLNLLQTVSTIPHFTI